MIVLIPVFKLYKFEGGTNMFAGFDKFRRGCGYDTI